jgi:hypothetical protein
MIDFDIKNIEFRKAIDDIRKIKFTDSHWIEVMDSIDMDSIEFKNLCLQQVVDRELLHRKFTI